MLFVVGLGGQGDQSCTGDAGSGEDSGGGCGSSADAAERYRRAAVDDSESCMCLTFVSCAFACLYVCVFVQLCD